MHYASIKEYDIANGLGIRVSLFVSGCTHHCKGCFNSIAFDFNYGKEFTEEVENQILQMLSKDYIKGLSILGGEPFEIVNQKALLPFIQKVKENFPNKDIWAYSGYIFETELLRPSKAHCEITNELLQYIDVLVDGPFIIEQKDITLKFRGSKNQRIIDVKQSFKKNQVTLIQSLMN